jgi:thiamine biosynthesis lipoprotein
MTLNLKRFLKRDAPLRAEHTQQAWSMSAGAAVARTPAMRAPRRPLAGWRISTATAFCLLGLAARPSVAQIYQDETFVFGTRVEITIEGTPEAQAREAASAVFRDYQRMHWALHAWRPGELTTLNRAIAAGERRIPVSAEIAGLIRDATRLFEQSSGLFNPAIGKLVGLWSFHKDQQTGAAAPDPAEVARLVAANPRMDDLRLEGRTVTSRNPAVQLDFGGYAKGYALDRGASLLRERGIAHALINIGGNVIALGTKGGQPWHVGIQHPRHAGLLATLALSDGEAIGTSGDYQRYYIVDGKRVSHIIDPRTGFPVPGVQAVTVLIPPGPKAGALSDGGTKPLFIAGVKGWRAAARQLGIARALLVDEHEDIHITSELLKRLQLVDSSLRVSVE